MSIQIKNLKIGQINFDDIATVVAKAYELKFDAAEKAKIAQLTPAPKHTITYDLIGANTSLANGWRRVVLDELLLPRFTVHSQKIESDDAACARMTDYIQNRIWLLPLSRIRDAEAAKKAEWLINVKNTTTDRLTVTAADIKPQNAEAKKLEWDQLTEIIELDVGKSIKIPLTLEWGLGYRHASFPKIGPVTYLPLEYKEPYPHPLTVLPTDYRLGLTVQFGDPLDMARYAWETLNAKLEAASTALERFAKAPQLPYKADRLQVMTKTGGLTVFEFDDERYSLVNIIAWYTYSEKEWGTYLIHAGDEHPEENSRIIRVARPDAGGAAKIMVAGCRAAIKDIGTILKKLAK